VRDRPEVQGLLGNKTRLFGFLGGEKQAFIDDPGRQCAALASYGLQLDARVAGSVEMVRQPELLNQKPQFLCRPPRSWSNIARKSGVAVRRDQVVLNAPIVVLHMATGCGGATEVRPCTVTSGGFRELDLKALLQAILTGTEWSKLGVDALYGRVRVDSTDPNRSNSGFMFSGLVLSLLFGDGCRSRRPSRARRRGGHHIPNDGAEILVVREAVRPVSRPAGWARSRWPLATRTSSSSGFSAMQPLGCHSRRARHRSGGCSNPKPTVYSAHPLITRRGGRPYAWRPMLRPAASGDRLDPAWVPRPPGVSPASAAEGAVKGLLPQNQLGSAHARRRHHARAVVETRP